MYKKLVLILLGLMVAISILSILISLVVNGNSSMLLPAAALFIYLLYIFKMARNEYTSIKKDKLEGIQTRLLRYMNSPIAVASSTGKNSSGISYQTHAFFDMKTNETITLDGDFSQIDLERDKTYIVKFYEHTQIALGIREASRIERQYYRNKRIKLKKQATSKTSFFDILKLLLIAGIPITGILLVVYFLFSFIQEEAFLSAGDYLFIQNVDIKWFLILFGFYLFILITTKYEFGDYLAIYINLYRRIKLVPVLIISSIIFTMVMIYLLLSVTIISPEGIDDRSNPLSSEYYTWGEIKKVEIYCTASINRKLNGQIHLHYILVSKDNKKFDLIDSRKFWSRILDIHKYISCKNIPINRAAITESEAFDLVTDNFGLDYTKGIEVLTRLGMIEAKK